MFHYRESYSWMLNSFFFHFVAEKLWGNTHTFLLSPHCQLSPVAVSKFARSIKPHTQIKNFQGMVFTLPFFPRYFFFYKIKHIWKDRKESCFYWREQLWIKHVINNAPKNIIYYETRSTFRHSKKNYPFWTQQFKETNSYTHSVVKNLTLHYPPNCLQNLN